MPFHGTAIAWGGQAVFISGEAGSGKSSLALSCIEHGAILVADDQTFLKREDGMLVASAPEAIAGCLAIRGVGVFRMPHAPHASVLFQLEIESEAPGWSEPPVDGVSLPKLALPKGYRVTPSLLRHLLLAHDGTRPDIWLLADEWRPERLTA